MGADMHQLMTHYRGFSANGAFIRLPLKDLMRKRT